MFGSWRPGGEAGLLLLLWSGRDWAGGDAGVTILGGAGAASAHTLLIWRYEDRAMMTLDNLVSNPKSPKPKSRGLGIRAVTKLQWVTIIVIVLRVVLERGSNVKTQI